MKVCLVVCLSCTILREIICGPVLVDAKPVVSTDPNRLLTTNTVSLRMPFCYFESVTRTLCSVEKDCEVWLVSSLTSATSNYEMNKATHFLSEYPTAYTSNGNKYSTAKINTLDKIPCPATIYYNFLVGAEGYCSKSYCNGVLPDGESMSFKYVLSSEGGVLAETNWLDKVALQTRKSPDSLGSSYVRRSAAMVVITTILSVAMVVLLLLLLIVLILICCCRKGTTQLYDTSPTKKRENPSGNGSLRILSYDVHHLNNASPYDTSAYEKNLKNRYSTNSTLPQKTTTAITRVQSSSPDNIGLQDM